MGKAMVQSTASKLKSHIYIEPAQKLLSAKNNYVTYYITITLEALRNPVSGNLR